MSHEARHPAGSLHERALSVLIKALQHSAPLREEYVRSTCEGDAELIEEVLSLLEHDAAPGGISPGAGARLLRDAVSPEGLREADGRAPGASAEAVSLGLKPGTTIDRYRLLQEIGEGGFGTVWMAEQLRPVKRKVALKIIKPGMDTKAVVARFEAERQALAMMDHPYIAKVLDGGVTESARPYFVMELVKGVPITTYCDEARLPIRERLRLFAGVCRALQHAHGKGVIHRDVKPSNVLVTLLDGEPIPKVIDFGIAKATSAELTQRTLFTEFHQMVGTPEYMAPEQTALSALDVDTRADVYSLGVLLYEMLTGTRPFELKTAMERGYDEVLRVIREEEPVKPSTRVSTLGETAATVASLRHVAPGQLSSALRGELDWIVLKALEKERGRRYDTAAGLAADIERYLADEPVLASPPSRTYLARKFVRRHRGAVSAAAALLVVLLAGLAGTAWGWRRSIDANGRLSDALTEVKDKKAAADASAAEAQEARQRTEEEKGRAQAELVRATEIKRVVTEMLTSLDPTVVGTADTALLRTLLDRTAATLEDGTITDPLVRAELHLIVGDTYRALGLTPSAIQHAERGWELRRDVLGEDHEDTMRALAQRALALWGAMRFAEVAPLYERYLAFCRREYGDTERRTAMAARALGNAYTNLGRNDEGVELLEEAYGVLRTAAPEDPDRLDVECSLALGLMGGDRRDESRALLDHALAVLEPLARGETEAARGPFDPLAPTPNRRSARVQYLVALKMYGQLLKSEGRLEEALPLLRRSHDELAALLGLAHQRVRHARFVLSQVYSWLGRRQELVELLQAGLEAERKIFGDRDPIVIRARVLLLDAARKMTWAEVEALWSDAQALPRDDSSRNTILLTRASILIQRGEVDQAISFLEGEIAARPEVLPPDVSALSWRGFVEGLLGSAYSAAGRHEDAVRTIEEALERSIMGGVGPIPQTIVRSYLANALSASGRVAEAFEERVHIVRTGEDAGLRWNTVHQCNALIGIVRDGLRDLKRPDLVAKVARRSLEAFLDDWEKEGVALDASMPLVPADANELAWWCLTAEDAEDRDPAFALRLARFATSTAIATADEASDPFGVIAGRKAEGWGTPDPATLDTLALAQFETGDVQAALKTQAQALELLPDGPSPLRTELEARMAQFEAAAADDGDS